MSTPPWIETLPGAVIVIDPQGTILVMNAQACRYFAAQGGAELVGRSVFDCHAEWSRAKLRELLATKGSNVYTIEKGGQRKLVYQAPWYDGEAYGGMVEMVLALPADMPHHVRD